MLYTVLSSSEVHYKKFIYFFSLISSRPVSHESVVDICSFVLFSLQWRLQESDNFSGSAIVF